MNVVLWTGFAFWFPGVGALFASRWFKRWGRESQVMEVAALLSVVGAVLLAIATPVVSEDPVWQRVLYDVMLIGWAVFGIVLIVAIRQVRVVERLNTPKS
ncbi:hypothetical protein [Nocardia sp. NPDC059239]|uniref:hypothetical protein n=1 Tax=Nocardia sp. NPDC059239 TaxID=3346785 RepID=UPI00369017AC